MRQAKSFPRHTIDVHSYHELQEFVDGFADGNYNFLIIVGPGGVGKSEAIRRAMLARYGEKGWRRIKGKHTPLHLYKTLYDSRNKPIVVDDLDQLFANRDNTTLIKGLCDTLLVKQLEWCSFHSAFELEEGLPKQFETTSRVCIITNDVGPLSKNMAALLDRAVVVHFEPSALEIHKMVGRGGWLEDEEVFRFVGDHLYLLTEPSFRFYLKVRELKRGSQDWRRLAIRMMRQDADPIQLLVAELLAAPHFDALKAPEAARKREFKKRCGGDASTYHRHKARLLERRGEIDMAAISAIRFVTRKPDEHTKAMLERRRQLEAGGDCPPVLAAMAVFAEGSQAATQPRSKTNSESPKVSLERLYAQAVESRDLKAVEAIAAALRHLEASDGTSPQDDSAEKVPCRRGGGGRAI